MTADKQKIQKNVTEFHDSIGTLKSNIEVLLEENKDLKNKNAHNTSNWKQTELDLNSTISELRI